MLAARISTRMAAAGILGLGLILAAIAGCSHLPLKSGDTVQTPGKPGDGPPPNEIICLWQPAQGSGLNGLPTRGVAGQILFFSNAGPKPIPVDGDIRIYLFDDQGTAADQGKPIHVFDVTSEEWQARLYPGPLGPTYQAFIPYVRGGREEVHCAIQMRLTPKNGRPVYSPMASVTLPGSIPKEKQATGLPLGTARAQGASGDSSQSGLSVRTISPRQLAAEVRAEMAALAATAPNAPAPYVPAPSDPAAVMRAGEPAPVAGSVRSASARDLPVPTEPIAPVANPLAVEPNPNAPGEAEPAAGVSAISPARRRFRLSGPSAPADSAETSPNTERLATHPLELE